MTTAKSNPAADILMNLMESMADDIVVNDGPQAKKLTSAQRKDKHRDMLEQFDLDKLLEMQKKMALAIDRMTANQITNEPGFLSPTKAEELMIEMLDQIDIKELLEVRREDIRTAVFAHITEEAARTGDPEPDYATGSIPVPSLGKKFVREGGNRAKPTLDETMFRQALGDNWERAYDVEIIPEQVIPERIEYTLDPQKVMALAEKNPEVLEALRKSLIPGARRTPSFTVRNM
jgi:hypothetical protein